jgi:nucleotide-binding universal stress UspA family protein
MLVPLDGSKLAEEVFPYARELAGRLDLDLAFLNVCNPHETDLLPIRQFYVDKMVELVRSQTSEIQGITGRPVGAKTIQTISKVVVGYPAEEILKYAEENDVDIILMSTHGYSGIKRWALGSVAYKVLHASKIPVWLVRNGIPEETVYDKWPRRTILVPLDGSKLAESSLPHAEALAKQRGLEAIEILLLSVCQPALVPEAIYYIQTAYPPTLPLKYEDYVQKEKARIQDTCHDYLGDVAKMLESAGVKVRTEVLVGNAAEEIIKYANKNPFQVIVMASHGRSGFNHLAFGSVAEKVLLAVKTPLFLVRPNMNSRLEQDQEYLTDIETDGEDRDD